MAKRVKRAKRTEPTARQHSDNARRERELKRLTAAVAEKSVAEKEEPKPRKKPAARKAKS
jgi:hypothetical protein